MFLRIVLLTSVIVLFGSGNLFAQKSDSTHFNKRKTIFISGTAAVGGGSIAALSALWYADYPKSKFHFFNDNNEWLQMDKLGHLTASYHTGLTMCNAMRWAGYSERSAIWLGGCSGLIYLSGIELLDGKSAQWGFSWGDEIANSIGALMFISQELKWKDQRIKMKFSYSHSGFAEYNSAQLGRNFQQRILKDYNGQTYWMSCNVHSFLASDAAFPKWINIAFGYGATQMTSAEINLLGVNNFQREREFYFSFDADLNRVRWPKKWMKTTARILSFIKIPSPTIRVQSDGSVKLFALFF